MAVAEMLKRSAGILNIKPLKRREYVKLSLKDSFQMLQRRIIGKVNNYFMFWGCY